MLFISPASEIQENAYYRVNAAAGLWIVRISFIILFCHRKLNRENNFLNQQTPLIRDHIRGTIRLEFIENWSRQNKQKPSACFGPSWACAAMGDVPLHTLSRNLPSVFWVLDVRLAGKANKIRETLFNILEHRYQMCWCFLSLLSGKIVIVVSSECDGWGLG